MHATRLSTPGMPRQVTNGPNTAVITTDIDHDHNHHTSARVQSILRMQRCATMGVLMLLVSWPFHTCPKSRRAGGTAS